MTLVFLTPTSQLRLAAMFYRLALFTHMYRKQERLLPIAFGITVHKGARLLGRLLQAIYMPNNVYCIHIDKTSSKLFHRAVEAIIRCLPNVFIARTSSDVVWGHFSLVQAQINCMKELLESWIPWKYYISLVGQDFPLYDNKQIVIALQRLNNLNSIKSYPMLKLNECLQLSEVFKLRGNAIYNSSIPKSPPPHRIALYKVSTHIVVIREFVEFVIHSKIGKDFTEYLKDTYIPDETLYASLQQHPLARVVSMVTTNLDTTCFAMGSRGVPRGLGKASLLDFYRRFAMGTGTRNERETVCPQDSV
ncbi:beta-1,3-galactosyl-O-glycosyl-glycoprotein beta-1,6-N-acetylglucosaminyltransferase [Desmophyllum pertusum]|uniref:Beta-1,3-galactosyl-O-glycosyl-glycoprotein beta-1,6-N-acetylglucosaminyltransferase n=1 Tax=Desmophyllum pertusum TaxID=174260 RepID=A0A9W9ZVF9_9CNID|nr:beta-1,3-galactosyl-O-glycosyl-glycoprotein beta-1,6-N-acetylglucosaminyltransferase [Desmophyllum pertusum]